MKEESKRLVEENMGLVPYALKLLNVDYLLKEHGMLCYDDLYQEGCVGLISAAEKYDDSKGFVFSTFAVVCIKNSVLRYISQNLNNAKALSESSVSLDKNLGESDDTLLDIIKGDEDIRSDVNYVQLRDNIIRIADRKGKRYKDTAKLFIRSVEEDIPMYKLCQTEGINRKMFSYRLSSLKKVLTKKRSLLYTYL